MKKLKKLFIFFWVLLCFQLSGFSENQYKITETQINELTSLINLQEQQLNQQELQLQKALEQIIIQENQLNKALEQTEQLNLQLKEQEKYLNKSKNNRLKTNFIVGGISITVGIGLGIFGAVLIFNRIN